MIIAGALNSKWLPRVLSVLPGSDERDGRKFHFKEQKKMLLGLAEHFTKERYEVLSD